MDTQPLYRSVRPGATIGDNSVPELVEWLKLFVELTVPENGIEYWSMSGLRHVRAYGEAAQVPTVGRGADNCDGPVCCARKGYSEGRLIEIALRQRSGRVILLCWAKSFASDASCWRVARACSTALESILLEGAIPEIVGMASRLPYDRYSSRLRALVDEPVVITRSATSLLVTGSSGQELDKRDWDDACSCSYVIDALIEDWCDVLGAMGVKHQVQETGVTSPGGGLPA